MCRGAWSNEPTLGRRRVAIGRRVRLQGLFLDLMLKCLGSFIKNIYAVFDVEEEAVGFGQRH